MRVLHLISHPIQYYAPLYRVLAGRPGLDLTVCFYCDQGSLGFIGDDFNSRARWDIPLLDGYRYRFLRSGHRGQAPNRSLFTARVFPFMLKERFDVVWVVGYSTVTAALAVVLARLKGVRVLLMDDATLADDRPTTRRVAKGLLLPLLFRDIGALYAGSRNRRFFQRYGVPEDRLFFAPHSVDNGFFREQAVSLSDDKRDLRRSFGLPDDAPVVLYCGRLVASKDLFTLLRAFALVRQRCRCSLLIAGDGPLRAELEQFVRAEGMSDVRVSGFLNQTEVGRAYAASDMLVLPSRERETWGLVVNEAMNFSLPLIVSDKVGCADDLVIPSENGYIFPVGDARALADHIGELVSNPTRRDALGRRSLRVIADWDISRTAAGVIDACYASTKAR